MRKTDIAGHVTEPEECNPTIGVEVEDDHATIYFDEGAGATGFDLTYEQLQSLIIDCRKVLAQLDWQRATWVLAHYSKSWHVQRKGEHGDRAKTLCGKVPPTWGEYQSKWDLAPAEDKHIAKPIHDMCKRCVQIAQKEVNA